LYRNLEPMRINGDRLLTGLAELATIGALPGGGVQRLAFTQEDLQGRDYVASRLRGLGLQPRVDAAGNLFAIRPGTDPAAPLVLVGSHTDTVGNAGRFDGALGVLAALEILAYLQESGVETRHPVGLVSFVNEEGVRFMPDMMGSLYVRGDLDLGTLRSIAGTDGSTIGHNLDYLGMAGSESLIDRPIKAFLELHIEQGPELESLNLPAAVVTGVQGLRWMEVKLAGRANHAGTTPMARRHDAGLVAGQITAFLRRLTQDVPGLRGTVGRVTFKPNLVNVIPSEVVLTVDLRHPDQDQLDEAVVTVRTNILGLAAQEGVRCEIAETASAPAVAFDGEVVDSIRSGMTTLGLEAHSLISGAGHDAQILASHCPAAMVFVRSRNGISHNPAEYTSDEDCVTGADILLQAVVQLAGSLV
jgi:N-carbamoyl-L-amino-acid hydrolase